MLRFTAALALAVATADAQNFLADSTPVKTVNLGNYIALATLTMSGTYVEQGNSVRFSIKGNPTTGYEWFLVEDAANGAFEVEQTYV